MREFDMNRVKPNKCLLFIGKKGVGKSCLVLDYLYHNRDIPTVTVISPTDKYNDIYKPDVSENFIHNEYTPELVKSFLKKRQNIIKQQFMDEAESKQPNSEYKEEDTRSILVLDDCSLDAKTLMTDRSIEWIFMNGRHANITMIVTLECGKGLTPKFRINADYIFIFREPELKKRKQLYYQYCGIFPNFEIFERVLMDITNNYGCLVIDNTSISDKLEDQVFCYKAEIHAPLLRSSLCESRRDGQFRMGVK